MVDCAVTSGHSELLGDIVDSLGLVLVTGCIVVLAAGKVVSGTEVLLSTVSVVGVVPGRVSISPSVLEPSGSEEDSLLVTVVLVGAASVVLAGSVPTSGLEVVVGNVTISV